MREVREFIVRVFGQQDSVPSGCGFLVGLGRQHIFTCCHVVNDALGRSDRTRPLKPLYVDFPFLAAKRHIRAEVVEWHYNPEDRLNDIAVLKLQEPAPNGARSATFVTSDDYSGDTFRAFGFPRGFEEDGRAVEGVLIATKASGHVQASASSELGYFIERGFSGAPIWNSTRNGVCGMAFQVDTPVEVKVASMIPTQLLKKAAPTLVEASSTEMLDPVVEQYLHGLIAELEKRMGVLQYVDLSGTTEEPDKSASKLPFSIEEFGFSEIVEKPDHHHKRETIPLGNIRDAINKHSRFVLIGDAGSSKTTTIRRLALDAAQRKLDQPDAPLPLLLYLPRWKDEATAEDFVRMQWHELQFPANVDPIALLQQGEATLYLDGLNEMGDGVGNVRKLKAWFKSSSAPSQVIVTCRKDNYTDDYKLELPIVQIEPLTDVQIRQFAENFLAGRANSFVERIIPSKKGLVNDRRQLYGLAHNPYMLSGLIIIFLTSSGEVLPNIMGEIIRMIVDALVNREIQRASSTVFTVKQKLLIFEKELSNLAYAMIENNQGTEIPMTYALNYLSEGTLEASVSATILEINQNRISFFHQLFQDFFASNVLVEKWDEIQPIELTGQYSTSWHGLHGHSKWRYALEMAVGWSSRRQEIIASLIKTDPILAGTIIRNEITVDRDTFDSLISDLLQKYYFYVVMFDTVDEIAYRGMLTLADVYADLLTKLGFNLSQLINSLNHTYVSELTKKTQSGILNGLLAGLKTYFYDKVDKGNRVIMQNACKKLKALSLTTATTELIQLLKFSSSRKLSVT